MVMVNPSENSLDADFHSVPTIHLDEVDGLHVDRYRLAARDDRRWLAVNVE